MLQIVYKNIKELKPYENNPRRNEGAVDYVANSIQEFGFKIPLVIDEHNTIVCGHTRYKASKKLKLKEVPCIIASDLSAEQIKAFRLADNKVSEIAEWDIDLLNIELDELEIDMNDFGFDFIENEDITLDEIEAETEKQGNVIVSLNVPSVANWNLIEDEIKRIASQVEASVAVKLQ